MDPRTIVGIMFIVFGGAGLASRAVIKPNPEDRSVRIAERTFENLRSRVPGVPPRDAYEKLGAAIAMLMIVAGCALLIIGLV